MRIGPGLKQQFGILRVLRVGRHVQWRQAFAVARIHVGTGGNQNLQRRGVRVGRRQMQRRRAMLGPRIAGGGICLEQPLDILPAPRTRSIMNGAVIRSDHGRRRLCKCSLRQLQRYRHDQRADKKLHVFHTPSSSIVETTSCLEPVKHLIVQRRHAYHACPIHS